MGPDKRARAVAFICASQGACAERIVELRWGKVILDSRHRRLWDANQVRVEASKPPDVAELLDAAKRYLPAPSPRMIVVLSEECGAALEGHCGTRATPSAINS